MSWGRDGVVLKRPRPRGEPALIDHRVGDRIWLMEAVIEAYKRDVDRTLLRENLKLSPEERVRELMALLEAAEEFQRAGRALRGGR